MKSSIFFLLSLIVTFSANIFLAMDDSGQTIPLEPLTYSFKERISAIDNAINEKYKPKDSRSLSQRPLKEKKAFSILELVDTLEGNSINELFIDTLMKKNNSFLGAINYYYAHANKNIQEVTAHTLEAVSNYRNIQPIQELNKIPLVFKRYVMKKAYAQITCIYNIIFRGHTDTIERIDTNMSSDLAASASKDGTFRLWKLSNGELLHIFPETSCRGYVKFNTDGSQLAIATAYKVNPLKIRISIRDTRSGELLYKMKQNGHFTHLHFFPNSDKTNTIIIISRKNSQSIYELKKDSTLSLLENITEGITTQRSRISYGKEVENHTWVISKNSQRLGLCKLAWHNKKSEKALNKIKETTPHTKLTGYEKDILQEKFDQKMESLEHKKPIDTLRTLLG